MTRCIDWPFDPEYNSTSGPIFLGQAKSKPEEKQHLRLRD
jgi:hypothetical protein